MRRRGSLLLLLLPAVADEWRTELGLDATPHAQRQAATWLADLDGAINFDMETLALDHALRRSQTSQSGWVATHAKWLARSECAFQREGATAPGSTVQTTMREGATPADAVHTTDELKLTRHRDNGDYDGDGALDDLDVSIHPVCVGDVDISSGGPCPDALCTTGRTPWSRDLPSPYYRKAPVPPVLGSMGVACRGTNGPRDKVENPVTGEWYHVDGTVLLQGQVRGTDGAPAKDALVELWHADPYGRHVTGPTPLAAAHAERGTLPAIDRYSLEGGGCRVLVKTDEEGRFSVYTTTPGAYGPPQHLELYVSHADGFAPLYTKVYFGDDPHLRTLASDKVAALLRDRRVVVPAFRPKPTAAPTTEGPTAAPTYDTVSPTFDTAAPTAASDTRAPTTSKPSLMPTTVVPSAAPSLFTGVARDAFDSQNATLALDIVLRAAPASGKDFDGVWSDDVGLVRVVSNGVRLMASESPSPRKWGALGALHATAYTLTEATFRADGTTGELFKGPTPAADVIRWSSGGVWRRHDDTHVRRYRYLRLLINETFRQRAGRIVEVDDIEIFGGVASHEDRVPPVALRGREVPRPFRCWATTNSEDCFKAFDKAENTPWRSADVGGWAGALAQTQVLTLDVGGGSQLAPTKLRIKCGAKARHASRRVGSFDCPRHMVLEGAVDGEDPMTGRYEVITSYRVANEPGVPPAAYAGSGLVVDVASSLHWQGRPAGASCGSCARPGGCSRAGPDRTCASAYCSAAGTCADRKPACGLGREMVARSPDDFGCQSCQAGKFSATIDGGCGGICKAGFFCAPGARSARDAPCPRTGSMFCPPGADRPRPVAAGFYALFAGVLPVNEVACPRGSYCVAGTRRPCPAGTYGNVTALSTAGCSAACGGAGEYCPEGSQTPMKCPPGSFCTGGAAPASPCPPGTIGRTARLGDTRCSGPCPRGSYCPAGSILPTPCPPGTYGASPGRLKDATCTALCPEGYYCPANSTSGIECGALSATPDGLFCPAGVGFPQTTRPGYYATGGAQGTRSREAPCEPGYRCHLGTRYACSVGTHEPSPGVESTQVDAAQCAPCPPQCRTQKIYCRVTGFIRHRSPRTLLSPCDGRRAALPRRNVRQRYWK